MLWRLQHPHEFFWEPIMKWWHRNRQVRIERDYWKSEVARLEGWNENEERGYDEAETGL